MTRYWFCRHGESTANVGGWLSGWDDVELTEVGMAQASAQARAVAALPIGRCLTSDLRRARITAKEMLAGHPGVPVHAEPALRERHMGEFQGEPVQRVLEEPEFRRSLRQWRGAPRGGEPHVDLTRRALAALRHWDDGTPTLVVAHGALLRDLLGVIDGKPPAEFLEERVLGNCELASRQVDLRAVRLPEV